jgi:hypothetical protein
MFRSLSMRFTMACDGASQVRMQMRTQLPCRPAFVISSYSAPATYWDAPLQQRHYSQASSLH